MLAWVGPARGETVPELIKQLDAPEAEARSAAAMELADRGEQAAPAVDALRKHLKDSDAEVRAHAARALGHIGKASMPAVEDLVHNLTDPSLHVRRSTVQALRRIKPGPEKVVPLMLSALSDKDPAVVLSALNSLAEEGEAVVPPMIQALKDPRTAYWACLVLSDVGPPAKDAVPQLIKTLEDERVEVQMEAAMALGSIGPDARSAAPELTKLLGDKHPAVKYAAVFALGSIGAPAAASSGALEKELDGKDLFLNIIATGALARIHAGDAEYLTGLKKRSLPTLFEAVKNKDRKIRLAAVRAIHELKPGPEVVVPAFARLVSTSDEKTINDVIDAVATLGVEAVPGLTAALKNKVVRGQAAEILGRIGPPAASAVPALIEALDDDRPEVRREVLFALGAIGPAAKPAVAAARKALKDPEPKVRYSAVWLLGRLGPDAAEALPELEKDVCGQDAYFGNVCAWALFRIEPHNQARIDKAMPVLISALDGDRPFVQVEAANTLGMIGPQAKAALPALKRLAESHDLDAAKAASDAIKKIGG
ncbi:MAG: HEAT repeat domain-containing protein [Planctomycetia bacterium]|nr:HEAT repeat domain-containing protein [Planctomycetia bacterium]